MPAEAPPAEIQYDLTEWIYKEMISNVDGPEMQAFNRILNQPRLSGSDVSGMTDITIDTRYYEALFGPFYDLNKGYGLWDIKRNIQNYLGDGVVLCGLGGCNWVDYSVPGNIHFGYIAASASVPLWTSSVAGGFLDLKKGRPNLVIAEQLLKIRMIGHLSSLDTIFMKLLEKI